MILPMAGLDGALGASGRVERRCDAAAMVWRHPDRGVQRLLLLTFALSGFFAYLLDEADGLRFAGIRAGLVFGSPVSRRQFAHIQVISSQWMPLALLGLLPTGASGRRWLVVFGAAWLMQALSNGYFLLFFPVLVVRGSPGSSTGGGRCARAGLTTAWVVASLPLLPVLLKSRYTSVGG